MRDVSRRWLGERELHQIPPPNLAAGGGGHGVGCRPFSWAGAAVVKAAPAVLKVARECYAVLRHSFATTSCPNPEAFLAAGSAHHCRCCRPLRPPPPPKPLLPLLVGFPTLAKPRLNRGRHSLYSCRRPPTLQARRRSWHHPPHPVTHPHTCPTLYHPPMLLVKLRPSRVRALMPIISIPPPPSLAILP